MIRDRPISSNRSPERAVTEIGVSCSDSAVFRAVTTTSSRVALAGADRLGIKAAAKHEETQLFLVETLLKVDTAN